MTPGELTTRVTVDTCAAVAALTALAAWFGGAPAGLGVLAGGALAVVNFRWLVARASAATAAGSASAAAWLVGAGLRFAACTAACGLLLATGWAHPVALVTGFTVLPCDLIARGLAASRTER
ncbi:MAG TPA: ATP synthase subunit I [Candidatus Binatia bacterium]|nr:ATP synthase subunit I [Candidatus Binatia bacterium]